MTNKVDRFNSGFKILSNYLPILIMGMAMFLAVYWVFLVPIFQSPDEDYHADYMFSIYSQGSLIRGADKPIAAVSHPYVRYLLSKTDGQIVKYTSYIKMPFGYGTKQFFQMLDKQAPDELTCKQNNTNPVMIAVYPVGYYALLALWIALISHLNNSLTFLFFSARLFSVGLLGGALAFSYMSMQELKLPRWQSILVLATIAFSPLTAFVGSYIQPDNLSFFATSLCFFMALFWRNKADTYLQQAVDKGRGSFLAQNWVIVILSLALATLFLCKYHFFCCVGAAILAMIFATAAKLKVPVKRLIGILIILAVPSLIAGLMQSWISYGCSLPVIDRTHEHWFAVVKDFNEAIAYADKRLLKHISDALQDQYSSAYTMDGQTFISFWGCFGQCLSTPLVIFSTTITNAIFSVIDTVTKIILFFTLISVLKISFTVFNLIKRKKLQQAFYLTCSNPLMTSYFLFVLFMFVFNIAVYHSFFGQGRHWFPLILPIVLEAALFAPRFFYSRLTRKRIFLVLMIAWLSYSIVGSYFAPGCIANRYYLKESPPVIDISKLLPLDLYTSSCVENLDFIEPYPTFDRHPHDAFYSLTIPAEQDAYVQTLGWAVDFLARKAAKGVLIFVDDKKAYQGIYGLESPETVEQWNNNNYKYCGYGFVVPTKGWTRGKHKLSIKVVSADGRYLYRTHKDLEIYIK